VSNGIRIFEHNFRNSRLDLLLCMVVFFLPTGRIKFSKNSVAGFSLEYALLNVSGYIFYSMYSVGGTIYAHLGTGKVEPNDLVFALHGVALSSAHLTQAFIYERGAQKTFALWAIVLLIVEWTMIFVTFLLEGLIDVGEFPSGYNTFKAAGYSKALITLLKYCPQVYLNYSRKSTVGWSIHNVILDFIGGTFSILQQVIDMIYNGKTEGNWNFFGSGGDAFNIVKFMLGAMSIIFDVIFMFQHFVLYRISHDHEILDEDVFDLKSSKHTFLADEDENYKSLTKNGEIINKT
jgi:cystinosin